MNLSVAAMNYYELLEVTPESTAQEIERAYRQAKETYSTSNSALYSMFNKEEALELHHLIESAYNTLSKPELKQQYDLALGLGFDATLTHLPKQKKNTVHLKPTSYLKDGVITKPYTKTPDMEALIQNPTDCDGAFLRRVRKYKGVSIEELAQFSKISKTHIHSLEEEIKDSLPARVFTRGFALQVARLLGLDSLKFASEYMKILDEK